MNYKELEQLMNTARDKSKGKPIDSNTRLFETNEEYHNGKGYRSLEIRLHGHPIIRFTLNETSGVVCKEILSCGYKTRTTKARINKWVFGNDPNTKLVQVKKKWYIKQWWPVDGEPRLTAFYEGMAFTDLQYAGGVE